MTVGTPYTVGTSSVGGATQIGYQRKCFHANNLLWVFYCDGTNIVYYTSSDGVTWTVGVNSPIRDCNSGQKFSIWFDGTYLHYAYSSYVVNTPMYYRRGVPNNNGTITWSADEQIAVAAVANYQHRCPTIAVDSDGYPWIAYVYHDSVNLQYFPYITKSGNNDGTWGPAETVTLTSAGYVNCVAGDIGKQVKDDGVEIGKLISYDNTARTWQIGGDATVVNGSVMSITDGIGAGTSSANMKFPYKLEAVSSWYLSLVPIPLTNGRMYITYFAHSSSGAYGFGWTGSAWKAKSSGNVGVFGTTSFGVYQSSFSVGDIAYIAILGYASPYNIQFLKYTYGTNVLALLSTIQTATTTTSGPVIVKDNSNIFYCFWAGSPTANHIYYKHSTDLGVTWDVDPVDWITDATLTGNNVINCYYQQNVTIGVCHLLGTSGTRTVRHEYLIALPSYKTKVITEYLGGVDSYSRVKAIHRTKTELLKLKEHELASNYQLIGPYSVVNVSHSYAIQWQDKVYGKVKGLYWVFWVDTDCIFHYRTSSDGQNWSSTIDVRVTNYKFGNSGGVIWDGTYFHVHIKDGWAIYLRIGEPQTNGTIVWKTVDWQIIHDSSIAYVRTDESYDYGPTHISLNCWNYGAGIISVMPYITKTTHDIISDGIWSESTIGVLISNINYRGNLVLALPDGKFCVLVVRSTEVMHELFWNGKSWTDSVVTAVGVVEQYPAGGENWAYSAVVDDFGNVHLAYLTNTYQVRYLKRDYATGIWSGETILFSGTRYDHDTRIVLDEEHGDLYVFIAHAPTINHIGFRHYKASTNTWDTIVDLVNEETFGLANPSDANDWGGLINADRKIRNDKTLSLCYIINKSGGGYTIKFLVLEFPSTLLTSRIKSYFRTITELLGLKDTYSYIKTIGAKIIGGLKRLPLILDKFLGWMRQPQTDNPRIRGSVRTSFEETRKIFANIRAVFQETIQTTARIAKAFEESMPPIIAPIKIIFQETETIKVKGDIYVVYKIKETIRILADIVKAIFQETITIIKGIVVPIRKKLEEIKRRIEEITTNDLEEMSEEELREELRRRKEEEEED